jgi:hypothetical protein
MDDQILDTLRKVARGAEILGLTPELVRSSVVLKQRCIVAAEMEDGTIPKQ